MRKHVQILAVLNIAWGSVGLLGALIVMMVFGGAMSIIHMAAPTDPDAGMIAIPIVGAIGGAIFLLLAITSIPAIVIGIGLLKLAYWARIAGIIISVVHLFNIPFGTALGIYGLWVLLSDETAALFSPARAPVRI